jgi:hypothetical protein
MILRLESNVLEFLRFDGDGLRLLLKKILGANSPGRRPNKLRSLFHAKLSMLRVRSTNPILVGAWETD